MGGTMDKSKSVLQEIATLIHIYKSMASDTILDREISEEITARYDAEGGTLKASKPKYGYDINKHMRSMFNKFMNKEIKPYVYPWQEGDSNKSVYYLLPNTHFETVQEAINKFQLEWDKEVNWFIANYDRLVEDAKERLGKAWKEEDYEDSSVIRKKFKFYVNFRNIPSVESDIRTNASAKLRKQIASQVEGSYRQNEKLLLDDAKENLDSSLSRVIDAMKNFKPKDKGGAFFKDAMFDKLRLDNDRARVLNDQVFQSEELAESIDSVDQLLGSINSVDTLRDKTELGESKRKQVLASAEDSKSKLNQNLMSNVFGGGKDE